MNYLPYRPNLQIFWGKRELSVIFLYFQCTEYSFLLTAQNKYSKSSGQLGVYHFLGFIWCLHDSIETGEKSALQMDCKFKLQIHSPDGNACCLSGHTAEIKSFFFFHSSNEMHGKKRNCIHLVFNHV